MAKAPGAPSQMASAPTRGMCRAEARRASIDVGSETRRVGIVVRDVGGESVDRCSSVGMWACAGYSDGLGCVNTTILRGLSPSPG
jgi:hypothetical protein